MSSGSDSSEQSADEVNDTDASIDEQERQPLRGRRQPQQRPARGRGGGQGKG